MRRLILIGLFLCMACPVFAETVTINGTGGWTTDQKVMAHAMTSIVLHENAVTHDGISVQFPSITVDNPSTSIVPVLTKQNLVTAYQAWKILNDAANAEAQAEDQVKQTERQNSELKDIKVDDVDAKIDAISSLSDAKVFLKKLVRYLIARGI